MERRLLSVKALGSEVAHDVPVNVARQSEGRYWNSSSSVFHVFENLITRIVSMLVALGFVRLCMYGAWLRIGWTTTYRPLRHIWISNTE